MRTEHVLGINSRNRFYLKHNRKKGRWIADSKLLTKKRLAKANLPTPQVIKVFETPEEIQNFTWETLPDNFVLKPCSGFAGEGIVIVKKKAKWAGEWRLMDDSIVSTGQLRARALDILAGQYSLRNQPDKAFIEERIRVRKIFRRYTWHGTPDIRIIIFNKVPVVAMLRLPSPESGGRANLHQGAVAVGIDLATGITTHGMWKGKKIKFIPWTKRKVNGLKLPHWNTFLTLAVKCQEAAPELGYLGVDLFLDKERGPVIVELNARPGLEVQNATMVPLRRRLERVEGLEVRNAEHGVKIAQALFGERFADRVTAKEGVKMIDIFEEVKVRAVDKTKVVVRAKIDTGAWRTSIDKKLARKLGLLKKDNVLWRRRVRSSLGRKTSQPVIALTFYLQNKPIRTIAGVADRKRLRTQMIIGRRDLTGFLVKPRKE